MIDIVSLFLSPSSRCPGVLLLDGEIRLSLYSPFLMAPDKSTVMDSSDCRLVQSYLKAHRVAGADP